MSSSRPAYLTRLVAALLLALVTLQATPAHAIPHAPDRGPAFSASSIEVALAPRRTAATEVRMAPIPLPARPPIVAVPLAAAHPTKAYWPANLATGPPPAWPKRSIASPREPPRA